MKTRYQALPLVLSALCGLMVSVAVAWACALWSPSRLYSRADRYSPGESDERPQEVPAKEWVAGQWHAGIVDFFSGQVVRDAAPDEANVIWFYPDARVARDFETMELFVSPKFLDYYRKNPWNAGRTECIMRQSGFGVEVSQLSMDIAIYDVGGDGASMLRSGWPWHCAWGGWHISESRFSVNAPAWLHADSGISPRWLPIHPDPAGLAADAAMYGSFIFTSYLGIRALHAASRRRRGLCPSCAYDRRSLKATTTCPECGTTPKSSPRPLCPLR